MRRFERRLFIILLFLTLACGGLSIYLLFAGQALASKWITTAGLLATITGLFQLEVSGLFEKIMEEYGNEEKYPYGPPSYVTREIIDNPDRPIATWLRDICFFNVKTGFWLIVIGTLVQVIAVWV